MSTTIIIIWRHLHPHPVDPEEPKRRFRFTPGIPPEDFEVPEIGYFMKLPMEGRRRLRLRKIN